MYAGINGVAANALKAYIGYENGKAKLWFSSMPSVVWQKSNYYYPSYTSYAILSMCYDNGMLYACGGSHLLHSSDGKKSTGSTTNHSGNFRYICSHDGVCVAVNGSASTSASYRGIYYSTDGGVNFTRAIASDDEMYFVKYLNGRWIAGGYGAFYHSGDGINWTKVITKNSGGRALAFGKVSELTEGVEFALPAFFSHAETPSSVKYLEAGQDLNDVMEAGFYAIPNTTVSGSLLNKPWEGTPTGSLLVMVEGNTNQRVQIMHKSSRTEGAIYERCIYQGTWGEWQTVHDGAGKILWTGGMYMTGGHVISFSEPASKQPSGIVLVFSEYVDGEVKNQSFASFFVPKQLIASHSGSGHCFRMCTSNLAYFATKYLYIRDDGITGHANNDLAATGACGITCTNKRFVLRYVLGV